MFVGIRDVTLFQAGYDSLREGLKAVGAVAVEVALTRDLRLPAADDSLETGLSVVGAAQAGRVAGLYAEAGFRPCALFVANNFNGPDPAAEVAHVIDAMCVAQALGVPVVRLDGAMSGPDRLSRRRRAALYVQALERVLQATVARPVVLAIENHGRQGNDPVWLHAVLDELPPARVGLTLDPANLYWAGYPLSQVYEFVEELAPRVAHVHVKNLTYPEWLRERRRPVGWEYDRCVCPIPEGDLDFSRVAALLKAAGYRGALAIEDESLAKYPSSDRPRLLQAAVGYLESSLACVGETAAAAESSNSL